MALVRSVLSIPDVVETPWVYFTTEANAYGAVAQRWFDGVVTRLQLMKEKHVHVYLDDIHKHNYLSQQCSDRSFYQCLASNLANAKHCESYGGLCNAVSLPSVRYPPCPTLATKNCSLNAFWMAFDNEYGCKLEKSCRTMEYRIDIT